MICLTGDLHHTSLRTGNQLACDKTEIQVAHDFLQMLEEANIKVTFFVSGKSFAEEWDDLRPICDSPVVELGGHNYSCFTPSYWHRGWKKIAGNYNGPMWYERRDVQRTIDIIRQKTGQNISCWRNHMYMHGPNTNQVLKECGIQAYSDGVQAEASGPRLNQTGLVEFPINVIPDHEHLYHAERTPAYVDWFLKRYNWSDDFGPYSYHIEQWADIVLECLRRNESRGAISNLIIHPITMYLADKFLAFQRILDFLDQHETCHLGQVCQDVITKPLATT